MSPNLKYAYYSNKPGRDVYHTCQNCTEGNNIEPKNRRSGTGKDKKHCEKCKDLSQKGQCEQRTNDDALDLWKRIQKSNPDLK